MPTLTYREFLTDLSRVDVCLICSDFDGTLSEIVSDPAQARPVPEALTAARRLAANPRTRFEVVTARTVGFAASQFTEPGGELIPNIAISGQYDRQFLLNGQVYTRPEVEQFRPAIETLRRQLTSEFTGRGVRIENLDGIALTLHLRELHERDPRAAETLEPELLRRSRDLAREHRLRVEPALLAIEVSTPGDYEKGGAIRRAVADDPRISGVAFLGDSIRDASAYEELHRLSLEGKSTMGVLVDSPEVDAQTRSLADVVVASPRHAAKVLHDLADTFGRPPLGISTL